MKITAHGATDGANIVLYWPDLLPADADDRIQNDPIQLVEDLRGAGKLVWFFCDSDGDYDVGIYIGSPPPEQLLKICVEDGFVPLLTVLTPWIWSVIVACAAGCVSLAANWISTTPAFRAVAKANREFGKEFPAYVVHLVETGSIEVRGGHDHSIRSPSQVAS